MLEILFVQFNRRSQRLWFESNFQSLFKMFYLFGPRKATQITERFFGKGYLRLNKCYGRSLRLDFVGFFGLFLTRGVSYLFVKLFQNLFSCSNAKRNVELSYWTVAKRYSITVKKIELSWNKAELSQKDFQLLLKQPNCREMKPNCISNCHVKKCAWSRLIENQVFKSFFLRLNPKKNGQRTLVYHVKNHPWWHLTREQKMNVLWSWWAGTTLKMN